MWKQLVVELSRQVNGMVQRTLTLSSKSLRLSLPSQKCSFDRANPSQVPNPLRVLEELTSHHPSLECFLFLLLLHPIATS